MLVWTLNIISELRIQPHRIWHSQRKRPNVELGKSSTGLLELLFSSPRVMIKLTKSAVVAHKARQGPKVRPQPVDLVVLLSSTKMNRFSKSLCTTWSPNSIVKPSRSILMTIILVRKTAVHLDLCETRKNLKLCNQNHLTQFNKPINLTTRDYSNLHAMDIFISSFPTPKQRCQYT